MTPDPRPPWELEYCLRLKFAVSYLDLMATTGTQRQLIINAYGANGDLDQWCRDRISRVLTKCSQLVADNGPLSIAALGAARDYAERLRRTGLFGNAQHQAAGFTRTE